MKECPKCSFCFDDKFNVCPKDGERLQFSFAGETTLNGRYLLELRLGKGGMGTVFKAKHKFLKTWHAIKIISPEVVVTDKTLLIRFHQEAVLAASIRHPNVVTVTDYGIENENMPFLVMEFIEGVSLTEYLQREKRLSAEKAYEILSQIARGLSEAHKKGIVHRDLKPLNVMLKNGHPLNQAVKVLDFGLAKIKSSESYASLIQAKTTNVLGSPLYMSPEQWSNENIDNRADIYSIGVMLYSMLAGDVPFKGDNLVSLMYKHLHDEPPSFASLGAAVEPEIEAVIQKALAKDPEHRHATVERFLGEYEQALAKTGKKIGLNVSSEAKLFTSDWSLDDAAANQTAKKISDTDSEPQYSSSFLTSSQNQTISSFLSLPKSYDLEGKEQLAQEFIQAQDRVREARLKVDEAEKLTQEFAEAQKAAEDARQKALKAQQKLEEDARQRIQAEMESKLAAEREARVKAEAEAERLLEEAKARKEAEERAKAAAQIALDAHQQAEEERQKAEKEAQQRQIEERTRRQAEEAAVKLAAEVAETKKRYEEAKKEAEAEAYWRLEAEQKRKSIEEEIKRNEQYEAERRKIAEAQIARQVKEQAERLEKQAGEAEKKANEARLLVELESKKRQEAEAAKVKAEEAAHKLAEEILEAQKRIAEIQRFADSESRKREQEEQARKKAEESARLKDLERKQEESKIQEKNVQTQSGNDISAVDSSGSVKEPALDERNHKTKKQILVNTSSSDFSKTSRIGQRNEFKKIILTGGVLAFILATSIGGYLIYRASVKTSTNEEPTNELNINEQKESETEIVKDAINTAGLPERVITKMVKIKGGSFKMGRDDVSPDEAQFYGAQFPAHRVEVDEFYLDRTEVTNEEYAEFVKTKGHKPPDNWKSGEPPAGQERFPVTTVSYFDARDFADWVSRRDNLPCRLPTEEEWEYAARSGAEQNIYPWGNEWIPGRANFASGSPMEVGTSGDATVVWEIKDMLGNVMEWTSSTFAYYPDFPENFKNSRYKNGDKLTLRGLSFAEEGRSLQKINLNFTYRQPASGGIKKDFIGFRLMCNSK